MTFETLIVRQTGLLGEIRLNRPGLRNALNLQAYEELGRALGWAEAEPSVRILTIIGEGSAFSAGADIKEFLASPGNQTKLIEAEQRLARSLAECRKPLIAALNGPAYGAGAELALGCDFILMARSAKFALPEIGLGNFLGGGASHILPRLVGLAKAREIVFLGEAIDGEEALRIGLANRCFSDASFHDEAQRFALRLAEQAPLPMRLAKRLLNDAKRLSFDQALDEEKDGMAQCLASQDWQEGLAAFQEKRKPRFQGR